MSGFSTPQGTAAAQPKQISSRLLNMKFMQRAAATTGHKSATSPSTPTSEPATKRRRTGDFVSTAGSLKSPSVASTPFTTPAYGDRRTTSNVLSLEINGISTRRGTNNFDTPSEETEWVLDVRLPVTNGSTYENNYEEENSDEEEEDDDDSNDDIWSSTFASTGRQTYGSFNKKKRKPVGSHAGVDTNTPTSTTKKSAKRKRSGSAGNDGENDEDLSSLPSESESESESIASSSSEGEITQSSPVQQQQQQQQQQNSTHSTFNFKSEADLKRMDELDYSKLGFQYGFSKQRPWLHGGGGQSQGQTQQHQSQQSQQKKKGKPKQKQRSKQKPKKATSSRKTI